MAEQQPQPFFASKPNPSGDAGNIINEWSKNTDIQRKFVEFMAWSSGPDSDWAKQAEEYRKRDEAIAAQRPPVPR